VLDALMRLCPDVIAAVQGYITTHNRLSTRLSTARTATEASLRTPRHHVLGRRHMW
jgi:hypothetical protein